MVKATKIWRAECDICSRRLDNDVSFTSLVATGIGYGWLFQYQAYKGIPRYNWGAYCPDHIKDAPACLTPDDLRCGISGMRHRVQRLRPGMDGEYIKRMVR